MADTLFAILPLYIILNSNLKVQNILVRWIPHLLTDEQKATCTNTKAIDKIVSKVQPKAICKLFLLETRHGCTILSQLGKKETRYG